jgi:TetR/AcrR family transcriptional regulator
MSGNFEALPEDKRQKILDACLDEFAEYGYINASTNRIVRAAGISKGLLFHYFESKKKLFLYVLDYTLSTLIQKMSKYSASLTGDFFDTMWQYSLIKTRIAVEEPQMYHIMYDAYLNLTEDIKDELMQRYGQMLSDQRKAFCMKMDAAKLREGVTAETAANIVMDFLDGYYRRNIDYYKTFSPEQFLVELENIKEDMKRYMDVIRRAVYKDGE